jgi:hypothetical protein
MVGRLTHLLFSRDLTPPMSPARQQPAPLTRITAVLGVALVLLLNLLAASPTLHAWAHAEDTAVEHATPGHEPAGGADHECAVTLFAHGVAALLVFLLLMLVRPLARSMVLRPRDWFVATRPAYWLVPSHAPPAA